jgi:hypothetical protein
MARARKISGSTWPSRPSPSRTLRPARGGVLELREDDSAMVEVAEPEHGPATQIVLAQT